MEFRYYPFFNDTRCPLPKVLWFPSRASALKGNTYVSILEVPERYVKEIDAAQVAAINPAFTEVWLVHRMMAEYLNFTIKINNNI